MSEDFPDEGTALSNIVGLSREAAWKIVGGLSRPTKMPCYAWGIPAQSCQVGMKLFGNKKSVCGKCYALKGYFRTNKVKRTYERRLARADDPRWIRAMAKLVFWQMVDTGVPYFRWFDSGDLQSITMLTRIAAVAALTPDVRHWLPTREYGIVREYLRNEVPPENLVIRVSAPLVDGLIPKGLGMPTSAVHSTAESVQGFPCPAYGIKPPYCGSCRACWNAEVQNVSYPLH